MSSRWDRILGQQPIPLIDHLLGEAAKLIAQDFLRWPLPMEELDLAVGRAHATLLTGEAGPPPPRAYAEAVRLADWDLRRELDAYDDYMRNRRYLERGLAEADRGWLLLLSSWLVEQLLALGEATQGRVSRARMLQVLEGVGRRLPVVPSPPVGGRA